MKRRFRLAIGAMTVAFGAMACSAKNETTTPPVALYGDGGRLEKPVRIDAPCLVTVETPPLLASPHVSKDVAVTYSSNPPSSGPHDPVWAAFKEYDTPVPRRHYVHDLEHGAVVLLYKCPDGGACPEIVAALREAAASIPNDSRCNAPVRVRTVITPDPQIDTPIAIAAWGWVYKAECVHLPSLKTFVNERYAKGPEDICANGQDQF